MKKPDVNSVEAGWLDVTLNLKRMKLQITIEEFLSIILLMRHDDAISVQLWWRSLVG
jgi:hypothetical protein